MVSEKVLQWLIAATPAKPWSMARSTAMTVAEVAVAFLARMLVDPLLGDASPYGLFLLAIVGIGYFCGSIYAAVGTVASVLLAVFFFIAPRQSFATAVDQTMPIVVFVFLAAVLAGSAVLLRSAVNALRARQFALQESEALSRQVADLSPQIVWAARPSGKLDYYNKRWFEFSGADPANLDSDWSPHVHADDVEASRERWAQALKSGEPYEVEFRLRRADGEYRWFLARALPFRDATGRIVRWFGSNTDVHDRKMAQSMMETLSHELSHRIKNIFAVVTSLVSLSVRNEPEAKPFAAQLRKRLDALGRAHDFARPHSDASRPNTPEPTIFALVRVLMEPYAVDTTDRLAISGDDIEIADRVATPIALIVHELATNATKYGALSAPEGHVSITGARTADTYELVWCERGGPPVTAPGDALGFGSRLLDVSAAGQLGGEVERTWDADGVCVTIRVPIASIERAADSAV